MSRCNVAVKWGSMADFILEGVTGIVFPTGVGSWWEAFRNAGAGGAINGNDLRDSAEKAFSNGGLHEEGGARGSTSTERA